MDVGYIGLKYIQYDNTSDYIASLYELAYFKKTAHYLITFYESASR